MFTKIYFLYFFQLVSALLGIIPSFGAGATMAFSAISATHYRTPNITSLYEPLDEEQSSWFGTGH